MSTPVLLGPPLTINTDTRGLVELADGRIAVLFGYPSSVQIYNEDGSTSGSPISLPTSVGGFTGDYGTQITPLPNGGFFIVYGFHASSSFFTSLGGAAFDANGSIVTAPFVIASPPNGIFVQNVAALSNGQVAVSWRNQTTNDNHVQVFNTNGTSAAGPLTINNFSSLPPRMAGLTGGNLAMEVWDNVSPDGGAISVNVYKSDLTLVNSISLPSGNVRGGTEGIANIAALSDGGFAVTYNLITASTNTDYVDVFNSDGTPRGTEKTVISGPRTSGLGSSPVVAGLAGGKFVEAWTQATGTFAQVFNADGSTDGAAALVTTSAGGDPRAVTAELGRRFAVTFTPLGTSLTSFQTLISAPIKTNDFNGDGTSDMLWQYKTTGGVYDFSMSNGQVTASPLVTTLPSSSWSFLGTGDFNNDGTSDQLWQYKATGGVYDFAINNRQLTSSALVTTLSSSSWTFLSTGDFNGDGTSDSLFQYNATGGVYDFAMKNGQLTSSALVTTLPSSSWAFLGTGDFNGDGTSDQLWQYKATGGVYDFAMGNGQLTSSALVTTLPSSSWSYLGSGDFNGDGTSDMLWQYQPTGGIYDLTMSNGQVTSSPLVATLPANVWTMLGTGDFNGDGTSDFLMQYNATGGVYDFGMSNGQVTSSPFVTTLPANSWSHLA